MLARTRITSTTKSVMPVQCKKKMKKKSSYLTSQATAGCVLRMKKTIYNHASAFVRLYLSSAMLDYPTNTHVAIVV